MLCESGVLLLASATASGCLWMMPMRLPDKLPDGVLESWNQTFAPGEEQLTLRCQLPILPLAAEVSADLSAVSAGASVLSAIASWL